MIEDMFFLGTSACSSSSSSTRSTSPAAAASIFELSFISSPSLPLLAKDWMGWSHVIEPCSVFFTLLPLNF